MQELWLLAETKPLNMSGVPVQRLLLHSSGSREISTLKTGVVTLEVEEIKWIHTLMKFRLEIDKYKYEPIIYCSIN